MGLAGHRIRPCYLGDWGVGVGWAGWGGGGCVPISGGGGGVRFKATAPGSLENTKLEVETCSRGHKTA